jgi:ubiquinone/menaquinone biosynthesis C-methylase UbiE
MEDAGPEWESEIYEFWNDNPCEELQAGALAQCNGDYEAFFAQYDAFRYREERRIVQCLANIDFAGKRVLEIGLGQGADSEQVIRRGAIWSGIDLTPESVDRVRRRLAMRKLPHESVTQGSVLRMPYRDEEFDIVFSHGVLHHVPNVLAAQREIRRVLKPHGELIVMLYARWSLNYLVSISMVRRVGLLALHLTNSRPGEILHSIFAMRVRRGSGAIFGCATSCTRIPMDH